MHTHTQDPWAPVYLVPCTLFAIAWTATGRGETKRVLTFKVRRFVLSSARFVLNI